MARIRTEAWPDRMSPTDALFWYMDRFPDMRSTIGALLVLERPPRRERVHAEFERFCGELPRMRQRVAEVPFDLAAPEWVEDPGFDLDFHLRTVSVPAPGDLAAFLDEISPMYATAFDPERPLWEAYVAEGLRDGRGAVFVKMHHCLTDGVGGSRLFSSLLPPRGRRKGRPELQPAHPVGPKRDVSSTGLLWRALEHRLDELRQASAEILAEAVAAAADPGGTAQALWEGAASLQGFLQEVRMPEVRSRHQPRRSLSRRLLTFDLSRAAIDATRHALDATINDVILAIVTGAMRRWQEERGVRLDRLRALVPVSLRREEDAQAGNRLALLGVRLPVRERNPQARVRAVQQEMGAVKQDRRARLYPALARVMTAMPLPLAVRLSRQQTRRTNFVCTNVPGPLEACTLAGVRVESIYPYAPLVGDLPVAVGLYSYQDRIHVGLEIDSLAMSEPEAFVAALAAACREMLGRGAVMSARRRRSVTVRDRRRAGPSGG